MISDLKYEKECDLYFIPLLEEEETLSSEPLTMMRLSFIVTKTQ